MRYKLLLINSYEAICQNKQVYFFPCVREDKFVSCGGFRKTYETCWRSLISPASPRNPCLAEAGGHFASTASQAGTGTEKNQMEMKAKRIEKEGE